MKYKIIRGYYLTGVGQEPNAYYFKIAEEHSDYDSIAAGDVCLTFYQSQEAISSIPAIIRIDAVLDNSKVVTEYLRNEQKEYWPLLPIVKIFDGFDPDSQVEIQAEFLQLRDQVKELSKKKSLITRQLSLFDTSEEDNYESI